MSLPLFELESWFTAAEGKYDLTLSHSDCEPLAIADLLTSAEWEAFRSIGLNYGPSDGYPELRRLVAAQYQSIEPDGVAIFNGPSEAVYSFMRAVLRPGDEVVVMAPLFQPLHSIARSIGCAVTEWRPTDEIACTFDVSALEAVCSEATKLIVVNFPHNPTGQMVSETDFRRIAQIARSHHALLFSDEVFRWLEIPPLRALPAACELYDQGVSVAGMSKPFGLSGLRIGWLATRCESIREAVKQYRFNTSEMTNTVTQWLACRALERKHEILARNHSLIGLNLNLLEQFVARHEALLGLRIPKAGTMAIVEQRTGLSSTELCQRFLDDQRVLLVPGKPLGMSDRLLRFGLGRKGIANGLDRLTSFFRRLKPERHGIHAA